MPELTIRLRCDLATGKKDLIIPMPSDEADLAHEHGQQQEALGDLKRYGVQSGTKSGADFSAEISCWLEMLPLVREGETVAPPEQTPVLFDLPTGEQLTRLAAEMLRLGNDRQGYRWLEGKDG